jgi:hypothetical protein
MSFLSTMAHNVATGKDRRQSLVVVVTWFAMGAFVVSTVVYHLSFVEFQSVAAVVGSGFVAVVALGAKAV